MHGVKERVGGLIGTVEDRIGSRTSIQPKWRRIPKPALESGPPVHVIPAAKGEPEHRHFDVRYVARTATPDAVVIDRAESNDVAWVPLERAEALMNEAASSRVIQKIRSRL